MSTTHDSTGTTRAEGVDLPPGYSERLYNADLAPAREQKWGTYSLFALWMQDVHGPTGYVFAAGLFALGLNGWTVLLALMIGILITFLLMNLAGFMGQRTGVPYPVICRLSFGIFGANFPAIVRGIVAVAYYGIGTYLGGEAIAATVVKLAPGAAALQEQQVLGLNLLSWVGFIFMWIAQLLVIRRGMETVRKFQDWAGPAIWLVMFALAIWVYIRADGNVGLSVGSRTLTSEQSVLAFFTAIALTITYFSTLILNFCDFSRFSPDTRAVVRGNFLGLPVNFLAFALVVVVTTSGTPQAFGELITNPVDLFAHIDNPVFLVLAAATFVLATVGIDIVADLVSPAYDIANIAPKRIDFRTGALISAVIAAVILPWHLYDSPAVINYFLGGLGAFLGPVFGIVMTDYYLVRGGQVDIDALYDDRPRARYVYTGGWHIKAFVATAIATAMAALVAFLPALSAAAAFSWFVGAIMAATLYFIMARADVRATLGGR